MGFYINPPGMSKEQFLDTYGIRIGAATAPQFHLNYGDGVAVCLVDNGSFTAAGIAFCDEELQAMKSPLDNRPRTWYWVDAERLEPYIHPNQIEGYLPDPELIRKWIGALRSGKYEQGENRLRTIGNKYCCLGVLCEVAGRPAVPVEGDRVYNFDGSPSIIANPVLMRRAGLENSNGRLKMQTESPDSEEGRDLVDLNDGTGGAGHQWTFLEIADRIEANLALLEGEPQAKE